MSGGGSILINIKKKTEKVVDGALRLAFPDVDLPFCNLQTIKAPGDFQLNVLLGLYNKNKKNPESISNCKDIQEMAKRFMDFLPKEGFADVQVNEKGFVIFTLSDEQLLDCAYRLVDNDAEYKTDNPRDIIIDYSSPNIAKEMHVGHLRSTIIGEATSRILESLGHNIERVNHVGDWGTQFGMLIEYMKEAQPDSLNKDVEMTDLNSFYKASKMRFDSDEDFKKRAQEQVYLLQSVGDPFARKAWEQICDISKREYQSVYDRLEVSKKLEYRGESFYNDMIPDVLKLVEKHTETVDGARVWFTDGRKKKNEVPLMLVKSDGGFGYDTTDIAALYHRLVLSKRKWLIYLTDIGQESHFNLIFKAANLAGWTTEDTRLIHLGFGLVLGEDGKKFKTRSGDTVKLVSLLDEAVNKSRIEVEKRVESMNEEDRKLIDIDQVSRAIGYGAVKYFDLRQYRTTNYKFSYDSMLDYNGNTAVYLLYAYARICSIFRKAGYEAGNPLGIDPSKMKITHEAERHLIRIVTRYPEILDAFETDMHVHRLCEYLYELCTQFTTFFSKCRVVGDPMQESRLLIADITRRVMKACMNQLGLTPVTRI